MSQDRAMVIFETDRLEFRCFVVNDARAMEQVLCDDDVMQYSMDTLSPDEVKQWICETIDGYTAWGFGNWAVVEKNSGDVIGYCGLTLHPDHGEAGASLNYRLIRARWGQGLGSEAAMASIEHAKKALNLGRIYATVEPDNVASIGVAKKVGMVFEKEVMFEGYDYPDHLYSVDMA